MIMLTLEYLKLKFLWLNENKMKINIKTGESCNLTNRTYKDLIRYLKGINTKSNVIRLKVHNTSIGLMRKYLLIRITNLVDLNLTNCSIRGIDVGSFDKLTPLESIDLSNNALLVQ